MSISLEDLIKDSEKSLKNEFCTGYFTRNKPRFPMLILFNNEFKDIAYYDIEKYLKRIWPQAVQHIPAYRYTCDAKNISFQNCKKQFSAVNQSIASIIDDLQEKKEVFADLQRFRFYNIIETSNISSFDDFKHQYDSLEFFDSLDISKETMVIILLDDSNERRSFANKVREFLTETRKYNSTIIISNRPMGNYIDKSNEWYRMVSNILALSNNHATSTQDEKNVIERSLLLFGNDPSNYPIFTVSYKLFEKPTHDITLQLLHVLMQKTAEYLEKPFTCDLAGWKKKLGFEIGREENVFCNEFFKNNRITFDEDYFNQLPIREIPSAKDEKNLCDCSYQEFCTISYKDVFEYSAKEAVKSDTWATANIDENVAEYNDFLCKNLDANNLKSLDKSIPEKLFDVNGIVAPRKELPIKDYYEEFVQAFIKKEILYPRYQNLLSVLKKKANSIENTIAKVREGLREFPVDSAKLGTIYKSAAESVLELNGNELIKQIISLKNTEDDVGRQIQHCFEQIIRSNRELFSLPFVEEWERRLNLTGENIYNQISNELTHEANNNIRLHGSFSAEHKLKIYLFNVGNPDSSNKTKIYDYLLRTFENDHTVQFFNTGYDDAMEGLTIVPCNAKDLLM